ncbi:hypothetical protein [Achromobacter sp. UMC46]|uniref:hypothetical protein n=1 Tax=Achromobacter sp. UMC46 TaxID=1862319 RepID=UPI0016038B6F|nr:hypothetical protein [Achromobacter sp. UMC46]MBB1594904.1 hypothetical protein [Achromobacter sp. UMC46]
MSRNRSASRRAVCAAGIAWLLITCLASASASESALPALALPPPHEAQAWPEVETVRTLLRADAAAALADCRMPGICPPSPSPAAPAESIIALPDDIRVTAIFGVARHLSADVVVNGAVLRYQTGRASPVMAGGSAAGYQLLAIEGACVRLRRGANDHTACLSAAKAMP